MKQIILILLACCAAIPSAPAEGAPRDAAAYPVSLASAHGPNDGGNGKYWTVEDAAQREKLPLYKTIPAARPEELTPANGYPEPKTFLTWRRSHGDNGGSGYSALDQITRQDVAKLQQAWIYHSKDAPGVNDSTGYPLECNPIIVRDVMLVPTPGRSIVGINAATGVELWRFKPEGRPAFRGLIYWPGRSASHDATNGTKLERVMFCAGRYLYALDPATGSPIAGFGDGGKTLLPGESEGDFGAATACPAIFDGIVTVPGFHKDVWGFDAATGRQLWTFHTVPEPGELGYDTWDRTVTYGANCWSGMALDAVRGIAYVSTGGPKPNFTGVGHRGQDLFANCVIAIDARTGKYLWHFQEVRHDLWDMDISAPPCLATITRDGRRVDVVAACTKLGNTLLLDRVTGKPIFPFRLRRAPTSTVPGEITWPYQPDPELPQPFSKFEFTADDLLERNDESADYVRTQFKSAMTGRFVPAAEGKTILYFGMDGGAEWSGACIDIPTGRLYVSANHVGWLVSLYRDGDPPYDPNAPKTPGQMVFEANCASCHGKDKMGIGTAPPLRGLRFHANDDYIVNQVRKGKNAMPAFPQMSDADLKALVDYLMLRDRPVAEPRAKPERPSYDVTGYHRFYDNEGYPANKPPWGTLNCIDLNTGKLLWKVPLGEYPKLAAQGLKNTGTENYGGPIVTAGGLVFCAGTRDNMIRAFDKDTGQELWSAQLPSTGSAPPASYEVGGRQYIVIGATGNKLDRNFSDAYVAFALPEKDGR